MAGKQDKGIKDFDYEGDVAAAHDTYGDDTDAVERMLINQMQAAADKRRGEDAEEGDDATKSKQLKEAKKSKIFKEEKRGKMGRKRGSCSYSAEPEE